MPETKEYVIEIGGLEHTVLLSEDDAKARGLTEPAAKAKAPANKARTAANKGATEK